ncbi:MAG: DUF58 domain-containing protein [Oscillospiraceae bacterium]|nr:DUF58 domain-containing protein [Oscillospiraceae bacterium]
MIMMKLLFLILIIACIFFRILYIWNFSIALLAIVCTILFFCFIMVLSLKHSIKINLSVSENNAEKNTPFNVTLNVINKSIFPVAKAEAFISYQNTINGDINEIELYFPIQARNAQKIDFQLTSKFCGKIKVHSNFIIIYDPIRLFKAKIAKNIETEINILPLFHEVNGYINDSCYIDDESTMFSQVKSGDDPSEVFDFHEYHEGDKPTLIHWKLSSKKDEFIVKELSLPINEKIMLFPDIRCYESSEYTLPVFDTIMESFMSVSLFLLENHHPHFTIIYDSKMKSFNEIYINDVKTLYEIILNAINNADIKCKENPVEKFFEEYHEISCSSFTLITHELDREIINCFEQGISSEIKNIIYVTSNNEEKDNIPCFENINLITVSAGKVKSSLNGIEL